MVFKAPDCSGWNIKTALDYVFPGPSITPHNLHNDLRKYKVCIDIEN